MVFEQDLAKILHRMIDGLHVGDSDKADLHADVAVNTTAATEVKESGNAQE